MILSDIAIIPLSFKLSKYVDLCSAIIVIGCLLGHIWFVSGQHLGSATALACMTSHDSGHNLNHFLTEVYHILQGSAREIALDAAMMYNILTPPHFSFVQEDTPMTVQERHAALQEFTLLPMFYLLHDKLLAKRKLTDFPRRPIIVATDEKWRKFYYDDKFRAPFMDAWGWLIWQGLNIPSGIDSFSIKDPFVQIAYNLPFWAAFVAEMGVSIEHLALFPEELDMPLLNEEQAINNIAKIGYRFWHHPALKMSEVRKIVEEHRAHEDFSARGSHIKIDFYRKYYHTRSKWIKHIYLEDETDDTITYGYHPNEFAEAEYRMWLEPFLKKRDEKDRRIIELLEYGYTQVEIAAMLGYANHSGVSKRIAKIGDGLREYMRT